MKKMFLAILTLILLTCSLGLTACSNEPEHKHDYVLSMYNDTKHWDECVCGYKNNIENHSYEMLHNELKHWQECVCGAKTNVEEHIGGQATCTEKAKCSVCNVEYGKLEGHSHTILKSNETAHWYECECGDKSAEEEHKDGQATCTKLAKCSVCNVEYGKLEGHSHTILKSNETAHWYECECGDKSAEEAHTGGQPTCTEKAKCSVCLKEYGSLQAHDYKTLKFDSYYHWYECECGDKSAEEVHEYLNGRCEECDSIDLTYMTEGLKFNLINNDTEYEVSGYTGTSTEVYIPSLYNGKPVTSICDFAFLQNEEITSIVLSNSVTSIGIGAFAYCNSLTSVIIGNNATTINMMIFAASNSLTSIVVTNGNTKYHSKDNCLIETATNTLIAGCKNSIIPNYVTSIGYGAFAACHSLTTIYCEASSQPEGWDSDWNKLDYDGNSCPVIWGYKG